MIIATYIMSGLAMIVNGATFWIYGYRKTALGLALCGIGVCLIPLFM